MKLRKNRFGTTFLGIFIATMMFSMVAFAEEPADTTVEEPVEAVIEITVPEQEPINDSAEESYTGWDVNDDGSWSYYIDGVMQVDIVLNINGVYYGFNYNGQMYVSREFQSYVEDGDWGYFRANDDGTLLVNQWFFDENYDSWYYYGPNAMGVRGLQTINGVQYLFYGDGELRTNSVVPGDEGTYYYANEDGIATVISGTGWTLVDGKYFYVNEEGVLYEDGVYYINGSYYGFSNGIMYDDTYFGSSYRDKDGEYHYGYYRAKAGGALYVNEWYYDAEYEDWYYYGNYGCAPRGFCEVEGKTYYFEYWGWVLRNTVETIDGVSCHFDNDGVATMLPNNVWTQIDGEWYYAQDGEVCRGNVYTIGGALYAFNGAGEMYSDQEVTMYIWDDEIEEETRYIYRAKENGVLYQNEWYQEYSDWYYYGSDGVAASGLQTLGNATYYFNSYGRMVTNTVVNQNGVAYIVDVNGYATKAAEGWNIHPENGQWIYVENGYLACDEIKEIFGVKYVFEYDYLASEGIVEVQGEHYYADANGVLVEGEGWQAINGAWYYISADASLYTGVLTSGSVSYYMAPNMIVGEILYGDYYEGLESDKVYVANGYGHLTKVTGDGFYQVSDNDYIYMKDGQLAVEGWYSIESDWYYITENGYRLDYGVYEIGEVLYLFDEDGKMLSNGWHYVGDSKYYLVGDKVTTGLATIGGKQYLFSDYGRLCADEVYWGEEECYLTDSEGVVLAAADTPGWKYIDSSWYYVNDGYFLNLEYFNDGNGNRYYFDGNGRMVSDAFVNNRYFGSSGVMARGWFQYNEEWYYANPNNGNLVYGLNEIGGVKYYFDEGKMFVGTTNIDGEYYTFASTGALQSVSAVSDGWTYADGLAYYYVGGKPYTGWVGNYYVDNGEMLQDEAFMDNARNLYYVGIDGIYASDEFIYYYYSYGYAKSNGILAQDEWISVDGNWYYASGVDLLCDGIYVVDGQRCIFDEDGVWQGYATSNGYADGWVYENGTYYYSVAGEYICDEVKYLDGAWYAFGYDGAMVVNSLYEKYDESYDEPSAYYYGSNGARVYYKGWHLIDGEWCYFDNDGSLRYGWLVDKGNVYYMTTTYRYSNGHDRMEGGYITGYFQYYGELYYFGENGILQYVVDQENGWYLADGEWYYFKEGKLLGHNSEQSIYVIDGVSYGFEGGRLATNELIWHNGDMYYTNASGVIEKTEGWYKINKYDWVYILANGTLAYGVQNLGGNIYYFDGYYWY